MSLRQSSRGLARMPGAYSSRRWVALLVFAAVVMGLAYADRRGWFGQAQGSDPERYHGKSFAVAKVVDGDTVDLDVPDKEHPHTRIRLLGVDTPETKKPDTPVQYFGPEATAFTRDNLLRPHLRVTVQLDAARTRDKYDRLLAYLVLPDGRNFSELLIATGHGYADPRFRHPLHRQFGQAQKEAMRQRLGLWKAVRDQDLPSYYRGKLELPAGRP